MDYNTLNIMDYNKPDIMDYNILILWKILVLSLRNILSFQTPKVSAVDSRTPGMYLDLCTAHNIKVDQNKTRLVVRNLLTPNRKVLGSNHNLQRTMPNP